MKETQYVYARTDKNKLDVSNKLAALKSYAHGRKILKTCLEVLGALLSCLICLKRNV